MATQTKPTDKKVKPAVKAVPVKTPKVTAPAKAEVKAPVKQAVKAVKPKKEKEPVEDLGPVVKVVRKPKATDVTPKKMVTPEISTANRNMVDARKTLQKAFEGAMIDFSKPVKGKA